MDEFTQNMLDRARQRRAALEARLSNSDLPTAHKPSAETNYSPNKRQCLQDMNTLSPSRNLDKLSKMAGAAEDSFSSNSPQTKSHKSRFAALAETINSWEDEVTPPLAKREKRQAPAPPVAVTAVKDHENQSPASAPAKPPRTYETDMEQIENVQPVVAEAVRAGQSTTKRHAPLPPTSVSVHELSPLHTSTPVNTVPSPIKMMKLDEEVDSPVSATKGKNDVVETIASQEDNQSTGIHRSDKVGGNTRVDDVEEKRGAVADSHITSATLIFGGSAVAPSSGGVTKSTPAKVAVVQKTGASSSQHGSVSKACSQSTADESMTDEPTRQPVAARLAAWQTKQVATSNQEPMAVSSRVKNFERKIMAESASEKTKSPVRLRSQTVPASNKWSTVVTSTKMSPVRSGVVVAANSPVKSVLSSPQKPSPATRAIQERLTQICEAGTRNDAVDRERRERAAELAGVEKRWQHSPAAAPSMPEDGTAVPPPPAPLLPSNVNTPPAGAGSLRTPLKNVSSSPCKTNSPRGKPPASPNHVNNASPYSQKREAARDKIRADFETKLRSMGFDVNNQGSSATVDLPSASRNPTLPPKPSTAATTTSAPSVNVSKKAATVTSSVSSAPTSSGAGGYSLYSLIKKQSQSTPAVQKSVVSNVKLSTTSPAKSAVTSMPLGLLKKPSTAASTTAEKPPTDSVVTTSHNTVSFANPVEIKKPATSAEKPATPVKKLTTVDETDYVHPQSDVESHGSVTADEDDDDEDADGDIETEDQSSDDQDTGDIDELLDEALDKDNAETNVPSDITLVTKDSTPVAAAAPVVMRHIRRRSSENKQVFLSLQEYRRQTARPKSQPPSSSRPKPIAQNVIHGDSPGGTSGHSEASSGSPSAAIYSTVNKKSPCKHFHITSPLKHHNRMPAMTVTRQSDVSRHEEDDLLPFVPEKSVKHRLQELQDMVNQELSVIQQTSNALNQCCHRNSTFAGSAEAVECHRLLLVACKKREACMIEMQKLREGRSTPEQSAVQGRLTISDIKLPLKSEFMSKIGSVHDNVFYFVIMIRHGAHVIFTQMVSTNEAMIRGSLDFPNLISLSDVTQDFVVNLEIYGMYIIHNAETVTPKKKSKASCTPKKLLTPKSSRLVAQSPGGPYAVRTTNFVHVASLQLSKAHLMKTNFSLDKVPYSFPLQGSIQLRLACLMQSSVEERGFLTMFEDVSGFGAWHRRWCVLKNGHLSYWKYPDDEKEKNPIGAIDLKRCITDEVGLVSRDVCARPNTFELLTVHRQEAGDCDTLVTTCYDTLSSTRHWLSSDTKEDRLTWTSRLNEALASLRAWHADALRPVKRHQAPASAVC